MSKRKKYRVRPQGIALLLSILMFLAVSIFLLVSLLRPTVYTPAKGRGSSPSSVQSLPSVP